MILKCLRLTGLYCGSARQMQELVAFMEKNGITPVIDQIFSFDQLPTALSYLESARHFGKVVVGYHNLLVVLVALGMMVLIEVFLAKTYAGKAIRATADNPVGARLSGVPVPRLVTLSFALAGAIAGLAGVLVGPITTAFVAVGLLLGLKGFIAAVIGGLGSFRGALVGGLILGLTENVVEQQLSSGVAGAILLGMLMLTLVLRPQGLFGRQAA